ncbi:MAG: hypothetical protein A4E71_00543 [Smithella sp. PtaU1.Bin162]|nr:MAG: hypothetical protein A4E71_00543 [Smithella sp. PtaU1.Bin162]
MQKIGGITEEALKRAVQGYGLSQDISINNTAIANNLYKNEYALHGIKIRLTALNSMAQEFDELAKTRAYLKSEDAKEKAIRLLADIERIQVMFKDIDDSMSLVMKNGEFISEISGEILTIREEINLAMMKIESLIEGIIR